MEIINIIANIMVIPLLIGVCVLMYYVIDEAKNNGHEVDLINLHEEKPLDFYDGSTPNEQVLNYR